MPGATPSLADRAADRAVGRRLAAARDTAQSEVEALLAAGRQLMRTGGRPPRVADIVAEAGLSNDAFYRYFAGKDDLVAAIVDDGARRLVAHVEHQIAKSHDPREQLRLAVETVMKQAADPEIAATTRAVIGNATRPVTGTPHGMVQLVEWLADALLGPVTQLGSADPRTQARLAASTAVATMQWCLGSEAKPTRRDVQAVVLFVLAGVEAGAR
jgi:AcrR family transcriptional regulator